MDNQDKIAHLGFIQGVINRMGNNSFLVIKLVCYFTGCSFCCFI